MEEHYQDLKKLREAFATGDLYIPIPEVLGWCDKLFERDLTFNVVVPKTVAVHRILPLDEIEKERVRLFLLGLKMNQAEEEKAFRGKISYAGIESLSVPSTQPMLEVEVYDSRYGSPQAQVARLSLDFASRGSPFRMGYVSRAGVSPTHLETRFRRFCLPVER